MEVNQKGQLQEDLLQFTDLVRHFLKTRQQKDDVDALSEIIREVRIVTQGLIVNHFLPMNLDEASQFCAAVADQLLGIGGEIPKEDAHYHRYCVNSLMTSFEWAHQIKTELQDDPVTQRVLVVDIPILRPFDYGLPRGRPIPFAK